MLRTFLSALKSRAGNDRTSTRRRYARRACDRCVGVINGKTYPVEDWSLGGLRIAGDERLFQPGQDCEVLLKFKLRENVMDIPRKAKVVRRANHKIALEFSSLSQQTRHNFQQVVDDYVARKFADAQTV